VYLHVLGWNPHFQHQWESRDREGLVPARVIEEQKEAYRIVTQSGEMAAEVVGRLRHEALDRSAFPAVGDWVAVRVVTAENKALIHEILPRRTKLSRKVAGERTAEQILVTNVDVVFLVTSLNADLNLRRIERYLGTIWESGAQPVLVLNKADLSPDPHTAAAEVAATLPGVNVHVLSAIAGDGLEELTPYIGTGKTVVLLGSSGVGKSTIINGLLHSKVQSTREIRSGDDRGRHATTYRRLFLMPSGGVLIDTPGMREFQAWDAQSGLDDVFEDIGQLATECRFRDCQHQTEPGCAVRSAIAEGSLDPARLGNYEKLRRELDYLDRRRDAAAQSEQKKLWKKMHKAARQRSRSKGR
jgi:ribosome biogenesis GTPase / thiamine phosphate phosphatase